ncbi:acetyl-CoA/propionyl-CoA carboxylase, biotin carboxylase, biotin carboxyl carrier protein [Cryobacterium psychrotolerans]|uniref:biotin carboxylase n=2 Tax=Cryobacterium psychrotolerans TaxID=386301 RepID=A0A1G9EGC6_9MICO|nr:MULTISPECIES: biotin carboxylase N-terminal domain-containing protein [Cryobacterium]TFD40694.1 ATP-grasp domain-containing protein [Cryobacterium sp. TMT1-2-1]TFD88450.1 ATP-grasp domain-containing protein [Cryobacterium psychrotolerans]SDK75123.1 acetyl-CoA/propionyl-CoA carboxylase, biotin carboxylase, biotin carboxyl carrier protein [Cryobacterium psychrotolerans]
MTMFHTVLVANRGEIACRIIRTLRELGIRSVAVYSDADRGALHVSLADVAVRIGPAKPQLSYLSIEAILDAAARTGAQAIHPGYGFLSENQAFARACSDAGVVFIGPSVHALNMMGDKIRSKNHVAESGVPVVPGVSLPGQSDEQLIAASEGVGYPMLIKPSAGGGGKGMHLVERAGDLAGALVTARRVASSAFGDDTLLIERFVSAPRHIEVQVLADNHGNVIHLGERECSLQRRHQKVIEEAPSPLLDADTRARIGEAACAAARSVGYTGAGTVEFLVSDAAPDEFFFMEMNTRLQVEHPVTEMVTGLDLVEWQVRVAAGETLPLAQQDVVLTGHAVEARVYAENPERGFLPTTGTVLRLEEACGEGIRVDSALTPGLAISSDYDPMLAKVIAWAPTRAEALSRLDRALADTVVLGVRTNIEYLRLLVQDEDVRAGHLDTGLIERKLPGLGFRAADDHVYAAAALFLHAQAWSGENPVWSRPSGWRMGPHRQARYNLAVSATESVDVRVEGGPDAASVAVGAGEPAPASLAEVAGRPGAFSIELDGVSRVLDLVRDGRRLWIGSDGFSVDLRRRSRAEQLAEQLAGRDRVEGAASPDVRSPMPGTVIAVHAASGDLVEIGQTILTVEAMKMEHKLTAATAGVVSVTFKPGDLVKLDQIVATIAAIATMAEPDDAPMV